MSGTALTQNITSAHDMSRMIKRLLRSILIIAYCRDLLLNRNPFAPKTHNESKPSTAPHNCSPVFLSEVDALVVVNAVL